MLMWITNLGMGGGGVPTAIKHLNRTLFRWVGGFGNYHRRVRR